jgi:hypothetical protein
MRHRAVVIAARIPAAIEWSSSDDRIAIVSATGIVRGWVYDPDTTPQAMRSPAFPAGSLR